MNITSGSPQNAIARELGYLNSAFYDVVRDMEGFKAVVTRYGRTRGRSGGIGAGAVNHRKTSKAP
jgi:hypothetical protein